MRPCGHKSCDQVVTTLGAVGSDRQVAERLNMPTCGEIEGLFVAGTVVPMHFGIGAIIVLLLAILIVLIVH
jgi:hypothetical protein